MKTVLRLVILTLMLSSINAFAQSKKDVKKHQLSYAVEKEINYEDGLNSERIVEERWYNSAGELVEYKDWNKEGQVKVWQKYIYNEDKTIKEKHELDKKGQLNAKIVYSYNNGLLVKKSYYDKKERLEKEKIYEYEVRK